MSITFYYAPMSSSSPVAWALAELGVPHEKVKFDLARRDQKKPEFLALNPNGKVPTLVVDGTPLFEALAIIQWLGDRFGTEKQLWPAASEPDRLQALAWTTWSYVTFGGAMGRLLLANNEQVGPKNTAQIEACNKELDHLLSIVEQRLTTKPYMLTEQFSLVDLVVSATIGWASMSHVSLDKHPRVREWLGRCQARPASKAGLA
ncbi:MAG: hypothetical protein RL701_3395 [Pseudomonadota bacterium]